MVRATSLGVGLGILHNGDAGSSIATPILDSLSASADVAFSTRKLKASYAGSALRVRRSSDNTELDIGFDSNGNLDTASLLSHVGANDGFIVTWYDQSGNNRNLSQGTQSAQLRIALSGTIETGPNSRPVLRALGSQTMTLSSWGSISQPFSRNYVISNASSGHLLNSFNSTPNVAEYFSAVTTLRMYAGADGPSNSLTNTESVVITSLYNGASSQQSKNGTLSSTANPSTNAFAGVTLASSNGSTAFTTASFCEVIIFGSLLGTTDRQALERNQGTYYGITVA